jgi:integrase
MARGIHRLTMAAANALRKRGRYADGGGLYLQVSEGGTKAWLFNYMRHGRARSMGLGPLHTVSLAEAREAAREARKLLRDGIDPIEARQAERQAARAAAAKAVTFQEAAERYIKAHEAGWRNDKHRAQWRQSLAAYAIPVIGSLAVDRIDTGHVLKVLEPIWTERPETASRTRGRIESVLDWAAARGYRSGDNPARWRGHLAHMLPKRAKVAAPKRMAALPYVELPELVAELRQQDSVTARALELAILTAARSGEALGARWDEVDMQAKVWTVPGERMKAGKPHRVPLSDRAVEILAALPREADNPHIFVGARRDGGLPVDAMRRLLQELRPGVTTHGMRSSFRDWAAEQTAYPAEIAELALAHTVGTAVERAYRRSDLFERRRRLMADWAAFCASPPAETGKVLPLRTA